MTEDEIKLALEVLHERATYRLDQIETEMKAIGHASQMAIHEIRNYVDVSYNCINNSAPALNAYVLKTMAVGSFSQEVEKIYPQSVKAVEHTVNFMLDRLKQK